MNNECVFYCTRSAIVRALECNADIDSALDRIEELRRQGKVRVVELSDDEVQTAYLRAVAPSVKRSFPSDKFSEVASTLRLCLRVGCRR